MSLAQNYSFKKLISVKNMLLIKLEAPKLLALQSTW